MYMKKTKKYNKYLILFLITVIIFIIFKFTKKEYFENNKKIVLVVARYNEDLEWLKQDPYNKYDVIIYNKGDNDNFYKPPKLREIIKLNNLGISIHSYFYHIINNYDNLDDITVFLPGSCMDEITHNEKTYMKKDQTIKTMKYTEETKNSVFIIHIHTERPVNEELYNFMIDSHPINNAQNREKNSDESLLKSQIRPFGKWYEHVFNGIEIHDISYKGIFSLTKEHIHNRSKESYKELMNYIGKDKNEETSHYFERSFLAVFYPIPENCLYR